jgi:hypothetical protein
VFEGEKIHDKVYSFLHMYTIEHLRSSPLHPWQIKSEFRVLVVLISIWCSSGWLRPIKMHLTKDHATITCRESSPFITKSQLSTLSPFITKPQLSTLSPFITKPQLFSNTWRECG